MKFSPMLSLSHFNPFNQNNLIIKQQARVYRRLEMMLLTIILIEQYTFVRQLCSITNIYNSSKKQNEIFQIGKCIRPKTSTYMPFKTHIFLTSLKQEATQALLSSGKSVHAHKHSLCIQAGQEIQEFEEKDNCSRMDVFKRPGKKCWQSCPLFL